MTDSRFPTNLEIVKPRRRALSRRPDPGFAKQIRKYAAQTGLASWAWNGLHAELFIIFWFLVARERGSETRDRGYAIWHTIRDDSKQRDMLINLARVELADKPAILARVEWVVSKAEKLGQFRNIAAHVPATFSMYMKQVPAADPFSTRNQFKEKFNELDHGRFWKMLSGDLISLARYAALVAMGIYRVRRGLPDEPWPRKPRLRSPPEIKRIDDQINRRSQIAAPKRPRSSSKGKQKPKKGGGP